MERKYYEEKYHLSEIKEELPMCIFIKNYNNLEYERYKLMLNSIFRQRYSNFKVVYIDDCSKDHTGILAYNHIN